jgi:NMD protein affecting ribosome stability and mRNA decay
MHSFSLISLSLHASAVCHCADLTPYSRRIAYLNVGNVVSVPKGDKELICKSHNQLHVTTMTPLHTSEITNGPGSNSVQKLSRKEWNNTNAT